MSRNKTILIIYPHWHPANLAGVHRPRLIGNYLKKYGYNVRVLTVNKEYFEETPDKDFHKTFSSDFNVSRVNAFTIKKLRILGDIGLRAFFHLYRGSKKIIKEEKIDFIWLPIPSFYNSLLGPILFDKFKIPYGIDYIDPWVRNINNQTNWRSRLSQIIAKYLEPIAIAKVSLISGVSTSYYEPVINRNFPQFFDNNFKLRKTAINNNTGLKMAHVGMPYGFDPNDHNISLQSLRMPWEGINDIKPWIYAGAFLPNSHFFVDSLFNAIHNLRRTENWDQRIRLYFIGTGPYLAKSISEYAKDYGLENIVVEQRERRPFLEILNFLSNADKIMLLGSTERHYTASKTFQCLLSNKPLLSILHEKSSAVEVIKSVKADKFLIEYGDKMKRSELIVILMDTLSQFQEKINWNPQLEAIYHYSSEQSTKKLVDALGLIEI